MPHTPDLSQRLDVEVEEVAGRGPLIPISGQWGFEARQLIEAHASLLAHAGRDGHAQLAGNA